jgi:hypothetical protein
LNINFYNETHILLCINHFYGPLDAFGRWICGANWFADVVQPSANNLTDSLTTTLNSAIDIFFPLKSTKLHTTDKPWISHAIKSLIQKRQNAFNNNDPVLWRHYKNKVKKEITKRKKVFYEDKVKHLKVYMQGKMKNLKFRNLERNDLP